MLSDPNALMEAWNELAQQGASQPTGFDVETGSEVARRLKVTPGGLKPLLDVMGDPSSSDNHKLFALLSLIPVLDDAMEPRLLELTQAGNPITTRSCAIHLLGSLSTDTALKRAEELLDDPEHRVRTAALVVQLKARNPAAHGHVMKIWEDPETKAKDREAILLMLPDEMFQQHEAVFGKALLEDDLVSLAREAVAAALGRVGTASSIEVLEQAAAGDSDDKVQTVAKAAADAIRAREAAQVPAPGQG